MKYIYSIFFVIFSYYSLSGQNVVESDMNIDNSIFLIYNYEKIIGEQGDSLSFESLINYGVDGFILHLDINEDSVIVVKNDGEGYCYFSDVLDEIKRIVLGDFSRVFFLFLDCKIESSLVEDAFMKEKMNDLLFNSVDLDRWPTVKEMVDKGQRIMVFSTINQSDNYQWLHSVDDNIYMLSDVFNLQNPVPSPQILKNHFKRLTAFDNTSFLEQIWRDANISDNVKVSFLEENIKKIWINSGRTPNFVILDNFDPVYTELVALMRNYLIVNGTVSYRSELVETVYWPDMSSYSGGKFSFPIAPGEVKDFVPKVLGFNLKPKRISIDYQQNEIKEIKFDASPNMISDNMEMYLDFEGNSENNIRGTTKSKSKNIRYLDDPEMGKVAYLDSNSVISLPKASDLSLTNHDFTISVWVNIPRYISDKIDYCVIGTNVDNSVESYLHGLHILVRDKKAYFGFFRNDIAGNSVIEPNEWYHIVCRYNISNGEQSVFVNGKRDASLLHLPSYKGTDSLFVGVFGVNRNTNMVGQIDELMIWSRALSEKEILTLYNRMADIEKELRTYHGRDISHIIILLSFLMFGIVILFIARRLLVNPLSKNQYKVSSGTGADKKN